MEGETQVTESQPVTATESSDFSQSTPSSESQAAVDTPAEQVISEDHTERPSGWDQVDFSPKQKERFDRVYGNMKRYENDLNDAKEINRRLIDTVNQLQDGQLKIVTHLQNEDFNNTEATLSAQKKEAFQKGDIDTYDRLTDALMELKLKKVTAPKPQQQPQRQPQQPQRPLTENDVINHAVNRGDISNDEATVYKSWASETDQSGNLRRPWIGQGDQRNTAASIEGKAVFSNPVYANKSFAEKLKIIDSRMGLMPQQQAQSVLGSGNLTSGGKKSNVQVTDYEKNIAVRTKFGGSKAKSDADHVEAWRQAKIKSQAKGARR